MIDAIEKFRGWWVPVSDEVPRLRSVELDHDNDGPPERKLASVWRAGINEARCALNREHVPPAEKCRCGFWALNCLDVLYQWRIRVWERQLVDKYAAYVKSLPPAPRTTHVYVIGRVLMWDCIRDDIRPYPGLSVPHWRARYARIEELWVPTSEVQSESAASQMAGKLEASFRQCRVSVGSPRYWAEDWSVRTEFSGKGPAGVEMPDHPEIGLHQPPAVGRPSRLSDVFVRGWF